MDKKLIFSKLKKLIDSGKKKRDIETLLNMPKNSLSGFMSGAKELPEKWRIKLSDFINNTETFFDVVDSGKILFTAIPEESYKVLCEYCQTNKCGIESLIESHKEKLNSNTINSHKVYEPKEIEEPIKVEDTEFIILKDGMKRRITKEVVVLLIQKYFPNEFKEASKPNQSSMNVDVLSAYQSEINDNLGYPDFLKNNIAPRIREDNNLTTVQKRDLLFLFGAK